VLLVIGHFTLPALIRDSVNRALERSKVYRGSIEAITLHLWRGAYVLHSFRIDKATGKVPVPFFYSPRVDLSVEWGALLHGAFVGELWIEHPELNFVHGPDKKSSQTGEEASWTGIVKEMFPLKINRLVIVEGEVHYRDTDATPPVDIFLKNVRVLAKNLNMSRSLSKSFIAEVHGTATGQESGLLKVDARLDPYAHLPTFDLAFSLDKLSLVELNRFFEASAGFNVKSGSIDIYSELSAKQGHIDGYIKPLAHDIEILDLSKDSSNPIKLAWQGIVAAVVELFRNKPKDQVATKIPISGELKNPETGVLSSITALISNAFVKAIRPGVESDFGKSEAKK
jgi:hypothetical protein